MKKLLSAINLLVLFVLSATTVESSTDGLRGGEGTDIGHDHRNLFLLASQIYVNMITSSNGSFEDHISFMIEKDCSWVALDTANRCNENMFNADGTLLDGVLLNQLCPVTCGTRRNLVLVTQELIDQTMANGYDGHDEGTISFLIQKNCAWVAEEHTIERCNDNVYVSDGTGDEKLRDVCPATCDSEELLGGDDNDASADAQDPATIPQDTDASANAEDPAIIPQGFQEFTAAGNVVVAQSTTSADVVSAILAAAREVTNEHLQDDEDVTSLSCSLTNQECNCNEIPNAPNQCSCYGFEVNGYAAEPELVKEDIESSVHDGSFASYLGLPNSSCQDIPYLPTNPFTSVTADIAVREADPDYPFAIINATGVAAETIGGNIGKFNFKINTQAMYYSPACDCNEIDFPVTTLSCQCYRLTFSGESQDPEATAQLLSNAVENGDYETAVRESYEEAVVRQSNGFTQLSSNGWMTTSSF